MLTLISAKDGQTPSNTRRIFIFVYFYDIESAQSGETCLVQVIYGKVGLGIPFYCERI